MIALLEKWLLTIVFEIGKRKRINVWLEDNLDSKILLINKGIHINQLGNLKKILWNTLYLGKIRSTEKKIFKAEMFGLLVFPYLKSYMITIKWKTTKQFFGTYLYLGKIRSTEKGGQRRNIWFNGFTLRKKLKISCCFFVIRY